MLTAYDKITGEKTLGGDADKSREYVDTLFNQQKVIPAQGNRKIHHFRYHESVPEDKRLYDFCNESEEHEFVKKNVYRLMCEYNHIDPLYFNIEHSYKFGKIADIGGYFNGCSLAIEVVNKHTDFSDYEEKRDLYHEHGIVDFWIFTKQNFNWEKEATTFLPIMEDLHNRFGCLFFYDRGEIKSMTMTEVHSPTMRKHNVSPINFGFDFMKMYGAERHYQVHNRMNQNRCLEHEIMNIKSRCEELSSEKEQLSKYYEFLQNDTERKDKKTESLPYFNFEEDKNYTMRLVHFAPSIVYKNGGKLAIYMNGRYYQTYASKALIRAFKQHPRGLFNIMFLGKAPNKWGTGTNEYIIDLAKEDTQF